MDSLISIQIMISLNVVYIYSGCDRYCSYSNDFVRPRLNYFIRNLKWCFLFISLVSSDHDFISNSVIVIDSCSFFVNYVFFYLGLFPLTHVSPFSYMIYWWYHVWPGIFCLVRWYLIFTAKSAAARMPIHGSASSKYVSCRLYVCTIFPSA